MEIRKIENKDLLAFLSLNILMYKAMDANINEFGAVNTTMYEINTGEDFTAIGLFDDNKLVGFMKGYCFTKNLFHFSGIYVIIKNNKNTKLLIESTLELVEKKYSSWSVNTTNRNISSIVEKYGAKVKHTQYVKEVVNG
jgi:hypothetical protein